MRLCSTSSRGAALHSRQRDLSEQGNGIVIELPPTHRIEIEEQAARNRDPSSTRDCARAPRGAPATGR